MIPFPALSSAFAGETPGSGALPPGVSSLTAGGGDPSSPALSHLMATAARLLINHQPRD